MKITVGAILFNSESILSKDFFVEWLKSIYKIGDEIILVEGATKAINHNWDGDTSWATKNGKSTDNTVEIIKSFPDPLNKIRIIEKNGFWDGKTSMCNEWAKNMTGDYIWQIDHDEFYLDKDVDVVKGLLSKERPDSVHFYAHHFWGDCNNKINEATGNSWPNMIPWMRIFRHINGSKWVSHEPPQYVFPDGSICNNGNVIDRQRTYDMGIRMFHYGYVMKSQIDFKSKFFRNNSYQVLWEKWHQDHGISLINGSKTETFNGEHPINVGLF